MSGLTSGGFQRHCPPTNPALCVLFVICECCVASVVDWLSSLARDDGDSFHVLDWRHLCVMACSARAVLLVLADAECADSA